MRSLIGGGFTKQLCLREGMDNFWIRSMKDRAMMRIGILDFMNAQAESQIGALYGKARIISDDAERLISDVASMDDAGVLLGIREIIARVEDIFLYTTSVPYFILDTLENVDTSSVRQLELWKTGSDELRARSHYREIKDKVLDRVVRAIGGKFGIESTVADCLTWDELCESLVHGSVVVPVEELLRRERCVYWDLGDGRTTFSMNESLMRSMKKIAQPELDGPTDEIRGMTAFRGNVRGIVRIIGTLADMSRLKKGEILVSHSTNPELFPVMRLCGAIVTDEGGIASHAAIVSRELKKPCVIGTKVATQVLSDGDLVEVDADHGVVRILRRS